MNSIKKHLFETIIGLSSASLINCAITSCSKPIIVDYDYVNISERYFSTNEHSIEIAGTAKQLGDPIINVRLNSFGDENLIQLEKTKIKVTDGKFTIKIFIDDSIQGNSNFNFNLHFIVSSNKGTTEEIVLYNFNLFYEHSSIKKEDHVRIPNRIVEQAEHHLFWYDIYIDSMPQSNIYVEMNDESTGLLLLQQSEFITGQELPVHIRVPISLNIGVSYTIAIGFNLKVTFINSYGEPQVTNLINCAASFETLDTDTVPIDYLDIVETENDSVLLGLKNGVDQLKMNTYDILSIPNHITMIGESAFYEPGWLDKINQIIIPKSVKRISKQAFYAFTNLIEIDLSEYDDDVPEWITYNGQHSMQIFNDVHMEDGYIWSKSEGDNSMYIQRMLTRMGLPSWDLFSPDLILPNQAYKISSDGKTLEGINETFVDRLSEYKIIIIPSSIKNIEANIAIDLGNHPYNNTSKYSDKNIQHLETRRLIIGGNVETLADKSFLASGISGPIFIDTKKISIIPVSAFESCTDYGSPAMQDIDTEEAKIYFFHSEHLTSIASKAFDSVRFINETFTIPPKVIDIGERAFYGNAFSNIIFPPTLTSLGDYSFADTYSWPSQPLQSIDWTAFNFILNPEDPEDEQTYIPSWFDHFDFAFEGRDRDYNYTQIVMCSLIRDEICKKHEWEYLPSTWAPEFLSKHGLYGLSTVGWADPPEI